MSKKAIASENVRKGLKYILLNHVGLWELLRGAAAA